MDYNHIYMQKIFYTILILTFLSSISQGQNLDWNWVTPYPQGNSLTNVHIVADNHFVAVGNFGSIITTIDGGESWIINGFGHHHTTFREVVFTTSESGYALGSTWLNYPWGYAGILATTQDGGITWHESSYYFQYRLLNAFFVDEHVGWLTAHDGYLYKTDNGGESWSIHHIESANNIVNIHFLNHEKGYVIDNTGKLFYTENGGLDWSILHIADKAWFDVYFVNESTGWLSGTRVLYKTENGGELWTEIHSTDSHPYPINLHFFNESDGIASAGGGYLASTTDGGITWLNTTSSINLNTFQYSVIESGTGLIVGSNGAMYLTEDKGITWQRISSHLHTTLMDVFMVDSLVGWIVGENGLILKTEDGGLSWFEQDSGVSNTLGSIYFLDRNTGWISGNPGIILKTTNGGQSWEIKANYPSIFSLSNIYFIDELNGWAFSGSSIVIRTNDGGETWYQTTLAGANLHMVHFFDETTGIGAGGGNSLFKTYDGGETWELKYDLADIYDQITTLSFTDDLNGWAFGILTQLRTTDGGENWTIIDDLLDVAEILDSHFINHDHGIIVGLDGRFFQTHDGGETWDLGFVRNRSGFKGISISGSTGILIGNNSIMRTDGIYVSTPAVPDIVRNVNLNQNYPNPFNPTTNIRYDLPEATQVRLDVYNIMGQHVTTLVNHYQTLGSHTVTFDATNLSGGVYLYRLRTQNFVETRKMVLVK